MELISNLISLVTTVFSIILAVLTIFLSIRYRKLARKFEDNMEKTMSKIEFIVAKVNVQQQSHIGKLISLAQDLNDSRTASKYTKSKQTQAALYTNDINISQELNSKFKK